ncbi:MAG: DUF192 domain-containing protein, partial [Balneolaceae bacterium]|nr:DUF192 domain-containing protein [Balneolaceae bacterium]
RLNNRSHKAATLCLSALFLIAGVLAGCGGEGNKNQNNGKENRPRGRTLEYTRSVSFLNDKGETITTVEVAVADEPEERNEGLMDVYELPADKGMLFIFENNQPRSFWMANTPLTLDIIFVNENMEIVRIHRNTQPFSEENLVSGDPAKYVIETNGGFTRSHDIREGMKVNF